MLGAQKTMQRVFQHYEGDVDEFQGKEFSIVKAVCEEHTNDVIVAWMMSTQDEAWYRIFIDGVYCGIDKYSEDRSSNDLDEEVKIVDYSSSFNHKACVRAAVNNDKQQIILHIDFSDNSEASLVCASEDGECSFKFTAHSAPNKAAPADAPKGARG